MTFDEVLPAFKSGKPIRHPDMEEGQFLSLATKIGVFSSDRRDPVIFLEWDLVLSDKWEIIE